jgi:hypothetical protein
MYAVARDMNDNVNDTFALGLDCKRAKQLGIERNRN